MKQYKTAPVLNLLDMQCHPLLEMTRWLISLNVLRQKQISMVNAEFKVYYKQFSMPCGADWDSRERDPFPPLKRGDH